MAAHDLWVEGEILDLFIYCDFIHYVLQHTSDQWHTLWSVQMESVRKDIECTFGILKCRFHILADGFRYVSSAHVSVFTLTLTLITHTHSTRTRSPPNSFLFSMERIGTNIDLRWTMCFGRAVYCTICFSGMMAWNSSGRRNGSVPGIMKIPTWTTETILMAPPSQCELRGGCKVAISAEETKIAMPT